MGLTRARRLWQPIERSSSVANGAPMSETDLPMRETASQTSENNWPTNESNSPTNAKGRRHSVSATGYCG